MKAVIAALAGIAMVSTPSLAADLFGTAAPVAFPASDSPAAEVGSNWYLRGDAGLSLDSVPDVSFGAIGAPPTGTATAPLSASFGQNTQTKDFTADVGIGYRFNNYLRADATYEYRSLPGIGATSSPVGCPNQLVGVYTSTIKDQTTTTTTTVLSTVPSQVQNNGTTSTTTTGTVTTVVPDGYLYNTGTTCNGALKIDQHSNMGMVNGYVDLGNFWGFTPFVGAGIGLNVTSVNGSLVYTNSSDGSPYNPNLTVPASTSGSTSNPPPIWVNASGVPLSPQPNVSFAQQNWNRNIAAVKYGMAWALMAGFGYQLSPSATLELSYRYLDSGAPTSYSLGSSGSVVKQSNTSQQFRIGFRYMVD